MSLRYKEVSADGTAAITARLGLLKAKYESPRQGGECQWNGGFTTRLLGNKVGSLKKNSS